jgi:hypothetical protein
MNIYLYYGNHNDGIKPVSDLLNIIKSSLKSTNLIENFIYTDKIIHNNINIIIEEFSNSALCEELIFIKLLHPKTKYVLFITEVPINGTYNLFDLNKKSFITVLFVLQKTLKLFHFQYLRSRSIALKYLKASISYLPSPHNFINPDLLPSTLNYFHSRYLGTKYLISKDIFTIIYNLNNSAKQLTDTAFNCDSTEFPYIVNFNTHLQKNNLIFFSGTINKRRRKKFKQLSALDIKLNPNLDDYEREKLCEKSRYTLHMPRYESPNANYSSPTRTLHALEFGTITLFYNETQLSDLEKLINFPTLKTDFKDSSNINIIAALDDYYLKKIIDIDSRITIINSTNIKKLTADFSML